METFKISCINTASDKQERTEDFDPQENCLAICIAVVGSRQSNTVFKIDSIFFEKFFLCFQKFHTSGILRFGMVLNGKAELIEKSIGATIVSLIVLNCCKIKIAYT